MTVPNPPNHHYIMSQATPTSNGNLNTDLPTSARDPRRTVSAQRSTNRLASAKDDPYYQVTSNPLHDQQQNGQYESYD